MERIINGTVIHGKELGRNIGFPTANLLVDRSLTVENGVYAARITLNGHTYGALVNIGYTPTVPTHGQRLLEAHLLNYSGDLYGKTLDVELVAFIRPEQKFASIDALRQQIEQDKTKIIKILETC